MNNMAADLLANEQRDYRKDIIAFSNSREYRELNAFYQRKSNFEILGIHRRETEHSRFIAWLLDPSESHGLGTFGFKKFLEVCVMSQLDSKQPFPQGAASLKDELILGTSKIVKTTVKTELPLGKGERIDIFVDCSLAMPTDGQQTKRLVVLIENKVSSTEHDSQTVRYKNWLKEHEADYDFSLLVYLTPVPTLKLAEYKEPDCECKDFLHINYQYLVDNLIEPALALVQPKVAQDFITDYLRALSVPSVAVENDKKNKGDVIMAITENESKLLKAFWEEHEPLFKAALYAFSIDPDQEDEVRQDAEKMLNSFSKKDFTPYTVILDKKAVISDVKKTLVGREVVNVLIKNGITAAEFSRLKADKSSGFSLLKLGADILDKERKPNRYRGEPLLYQGETYYASSNWGENNIPRFQKFLAENFPRIQLRKENAEAEGLGEA